MITGWTLFAIALLVWQNTLDQTWATDRDLPLAFELVVWLLGFPFLLGLAIWAAGWDDTLRGTLLAVVVVGYTLMFVPRAPVMSFPRAAGKRD
jgi:hypothetical protein